MKKYIIFGLLFLYIANGFSQEKKVSMQLLSIIGVKNEIKIKFEFINSSEKDIAVYIPTSQDICKKIFKIKFISTKDSTIHTYEPCTWYTDLSSIKFNCMNCIILSPEEKRIVNMTLSKKHFSPFLNINTYYKVFLAVYLKDVYIESVFSNYLKEDVSTNYIIYNNI